MKFYRLNFTSNDIIGYQFFDSLADANKQVRSWMTDNPAGSAVVDEIEIQPTKAGILEALSRYATRITIDTPAKV